MKIMGPHVLALVGALWCGSAQAQTVARCDLVVTTTLSRNAEVPTPTTCPCRITAFQATLYDRFAEVIWTTDVMDAFPHGLLNTKDLKDGTYLWKVKYTAVADGEALELERTGYIMVL